MSEDDDDGLVLNFGGSQEGITKKPQKRGSSKQRWLHQRKQSRATSVVRHAPSNTQQASAEPKTEKNGEFKPSKEVISKPEDLVPDFPEKGGTSLIPMKSSLGIGNEASKKAFKDVRVEESKEESATGSGRTGRAVDDEVVAVKSECVFAAESFADLGISAALSDHMRDHLKFTSPTRIQKQAIPAILTGQDVLVRADTGTGKTMVYLAPIFHKIQSLPDRISRADGTYALILAPTRELCLQIHAAACQLARRFVYIVPGHVVGGENRAKEKARLRKGVTILIATPGRLLDHLKNTSSLVTKNLKQVVFDEADRLLDLGFEKDIFDILSILRKSSSSSSSSSSSHPWQTVLLSATLGDRVASLASGSLQNPITVKVESEEERKEEGEGGDGGKVGKEGKNEEEEEEWDFEDNGASQNFTIPSQLAQHFIRVPCRLRLVALAALLHWKCRQLACKIVVFFSTCDAVEFHHAFFTAFQIVPWKRLYKPQKNAPEPRRSSNGGKQGEDGGKDKEEADGGVEGVFEEGDADWEYNVAGKQPITKLHGSMTQKERGAAFLGFSSAKSGVLFCTDVAARGLDFPGVTCIVQYDPAGEPAAYVHRVGRSARLGRVGESILFLQPSEMEYVAEMKQHGVSMTEMSLISVLDKLPLGKTKKGTRGEIVMAENHIGAAMLATRLEGFIANESVLYELATDAFRSFIRAYAAHRGNLKQIFHPKKLHFGHVAKSFGLMDAPSILGQSSTKKALLKRKEEQFANLKRKKRKLYPAHMSE